MVRLTIFLLVLATGLFFAKDYLIGFSIDDAKNLPTDVATCVEKTTQDKQMSKDAEKTARDWGQKANVFLNTPEKKPTYPTKQNLEENKGSLTQAGKDAIAKCQAIKQQARPPMPPKVEL